MPSQIIIVGAGVVGAATALTFAERGFRVTVVDQADHVAAATSAANGAQLSYSYTDAFASPAMLRNLPGIFAGLDPAVRFANRCDPELLTWGWRFIRNATQKRSDANTLSTLAIAMQSRQVMHRWIQKYAIDFEYRRAGKLHLYDDVHALRSAEARVRLKNRYGSRQSVLGADEALALEPSLLKLRGRLAGAVFSPDDELGDAARFTEGALNRVVASNGVLHLGVRVDGFIMEGDRCRAVQTSAGNLDTDYVVLCAGIHTRSLARQLGVKLPLMPVSGYSLTYASSHDTPEISVTDTHRRLVICRLGKQVRIAGLADVGLMTATPDINRIRQLDDTVKWRFPKAASYAGESRPWIGVRSMTPDSQPIVSRCGALNVFVNCGHGMLGWTLAAGTAERVADMIMPVADPVIDPAVTQSA